MISPEAKTTDKEKPKAALPAVPSLPAVQTLPVVPGTSQGKLDQSNKPLTGIPATTDDQLPDLVLAHDDPDVSQATGAVSTEEEIDTAETLLSLGEVRNDTLDHDDENAVLMPIGGPNITVDVAPERIRLDQVNVDKAIVELIQNDQNDDQADQADKVLIRRMLKRLHHQLLQTAMTQLKTGRKVLGKTLNRPPEAD